MLVVKLIVPINYHKYYYYEQEKLTNKIHVFILQKLLR